MSCEIRRGSDRFRTSGEGRETYHSFSFGSHYDAANVGVGPLVAHNDERLEPGAGYAAHRHRGVELVTWVVSGSLRHEDSSGDHEELAAGTVQVHSAGAGIEHAEQAGPGPGPTRFVQAWLRPDEPDLPSHRRRIEAPDLVGSEFVPVVSGSLDAPLPLGVQGATLWAVVPPVAAVVPLPDLLRGHLFVAAGGARLAGRGADEGTGHLSEGDAVRLVDEPGWSVAPEPGSLLLLWTFRQPACP